MIDRNISQDRLNYLWILAYAAALVFLLCLINLQVLMSSRYREIAEKNRTQVMSQAAPRGRIFTSDGAAVATNKPSFSLIYFPGQLKTTSETEALASGIARQLSLPYEALRSTLFKSARMGTPVRLAENLSSKTMLSLSELKTIYLVLYCVFCRQKYNRYAGCRGVFIQSIFHLKTVNIRHHNIQ